MQHDDELSRAAREAVHCATHSIGNLAQRLQDIFARNKPRKRPAYIPPPSAYNPPDAFKRACLRLQATAHTYGNGYELSNPQKFAHFIEDVRTIAANISSNVSSAASCEFNLED
jgi:hypothetical protein